MGDEMAMAPRPWWMVKRVVAASSAMERSSAGEAREPSMHPLSEN